MKNWKFDLFNFRNSLTLDQIEISSVVKESSRQGSLSFTFEMLSSTNINLKDILAIESAKLYEKMKSSEPIKNKTL